MPEFKGQKKLLIITYYWPPAGGPGVQRWLKFTRYLPDFGILPFVLTVEEDQASYAQRDGSLLKDVPSNVGIYRTPTREWYSLYLRLTGKENIPFSGFVKESKPGFNENVIRFLRTHLFIPDPRKGWNAFAVKKAADLIRSENINSLVTTGPPHSSHLIGLQLKRKFPSLNWVADFRDPWTHIFFFDQLMHSPLSIYLHKRLERKVLEGSNKVVVVGNSMKKDFLDDHGKYVDSEKIVIIPNGYDDTDFEFEHPVPDEHFTITYAGTLALQYRIDALVDALSEINAERSDPVKLRLVGEICEEHDALLHQRLNPGSFELVPRVSHKESIQYLYRSHILLLVIPDTPGNNSILTGKLFEYLATQKPILGIGPIQGDAATILMETDSGCMFAYSDRSAIKEYLLSLIHNLDKNSGQPYNKLIREYSRRILSGKLAQLFSKE